MQLPSINMSIEAWILIPAISAPPNNRRTWMSWMWLPRMVLKTAPKLPTMPACSQWEMWLPLTMWLPMRSFDGLPSDLREYVYSSFVAHNKDVAPAVQPKIDNTEAFVRKIIRNVEPRPWPWMTRRMDEAFRDVEPAPPERRKR